MFINIDTKRFGMMCLFATLSIILIYLGKIISINTLFFVVSASFIVGMICTTYGERLGLLFLFVCFALSLLLLPNKGHCITYVVFGVNILVIHDTNNHLIRLLFFNLTYIPIVLFFPQLIIFKEQVLMSLIIIILFGVIILIAQRIKDSYTIKLYIKLIVIPVMLLLFILPKLIIERKMKFNFLIISILVGQAGYFFLCYAYRRFENEIGKKLIKKLF